MKPIVINKKEILEEVQAKYAQICVEKATSIYKQMVHNIRKQAV